jgi:hypothetical protein
VVVAPPAWQREQFFLQVLADTKRANAEAPGFTLGGDRQGRGRCLQMSFGYCGLASNNKCSLNSVFSLAAPAESACTVPRSFPST